MKTIYLLLIVSLISILPLNAQQPKVVKWDSVGQKVRIKKCDIVIEEWSNISVENKYITYSSRPDGDYVLQLKNIRPIVDTLLKLSVVRSVSVSKTTTPITDTVENPNAVRTIQFDSLRQREKILYGELVNTRIKGEAVAFRSYFSFESDYDGYWMELSDAQSIRPINFDCMCKTFIVLSPKTTDVNFDDRLRYEQIVWTPRKDRTWEVRIGNVRRGCRSEALEELPDLRTREYENNKPTCDDVKKGKK